MARVSELRILYWLARFRRFMAPYEAEEPLAGNFRAKQLQAVLGLTPLAMVVNLFNAAVVMSRMAAYAPWLWIWFLVLVLFAGQGLRAWYRTRNRPPRPRASTKAMRRALRHAAGLGALWGTLPALLLPIAVPQDQHMLTIVSCGMICAGGFALVTVPAAAMSYVCILTAGSAIGLLRIDMPGAHVLLCLLLVYSGVVIASVRVMGRSYGSRLVAEADAAHKEQIVGLLLRDFEENSSDFLWELSPGGHLGHTSSRLAKALQFDLQRDAELSLVALIARTHSRHPQAAADADAVEHLEKLQLALATPQPFRDLVVPIVLNGTQRWWALTAKPVRQPENMLHGWRGVGADITDSKYAEDEMQRLAHFDALTGLANRRHFQHRLQQLCTQDRGAPGAASLLCIDMDNFKRVNDAYGHANGDILLKAVAQRMHGSIRARDLVARLGGDEFAILLDGIAQPDEVRLFTERLMHTIEQPCDLSGICVTPHTSIGIALLPRDGRQADEILHRADLALYEAKARGRRQAQFFSLAMDEKSRRRIALEDDLRHALQQGELQLVYQPQVSLANHQITGVEALLRWSSARFGSVSPAELIPIAEEAGLIRDIGLWVLETACLAARQLPDHLLMAVNLSASQFDDALLVDKVLALLHNTGIDPRRLELEITESVFLADTDDVLAALHRLRAAGIRIALDDFGTGYSSLAYLRSFPFNKLKIDRSFVMHIGDSSESDAIVQSVITLASALHMVTTAEGIETAGQCERLTQLACTTGQGYYFARPLGLDALLALLAQPAPLPRN